ncbi:hypothetical protein ACWDOR_44130, partial [Streptosporangium canum]
STTRCESPVRMSADSAMKCTPQKTMYSASGRAPYRGHACLPVTGRAPGARATVVVMDASPSPSWS